MLNHFARFWTWALPMREPRRTSEGYPIVVSPDARVSLDTNGDEFLQNRRGIIFISNHIGARIWEVLRDGESVEPIAARISQDNGAPQDLVRQDTAQFIAELETQGFLSRRIGS